MTKDELAKVLSKMYIKSFFSSDDEPVISIDVGWDIIKVTKFTKLADGKCKSELLEEVATANHSVSRGDVVVNKYKALYKDVRTVATISDKIEYLGNFEDLVVKENK